MTCNREGGTVGFNLVSKGAELLPTGLEAISVLGIKLSLTHMTLVLAFSARRESCSLLAWLWVCSLFVNSIPLSLFPRGQRTLEFYRSYKRESCWEGLPISKESDIEM